jgi:nucleoside-diphosphate-sugar epimerase
VLTFFLNDQNATDFKRDLIDPAINATIGVLKSAKKVSSIKRVVITSSVAALLSWEFIISSDYTTVLTGMYPSNPSTSQLAHKTTPFPAKDVYTPTGLDGPFANAIHAYGVSKAAAFDATKRFIEEENPAFEIVNILPSMVTGKNELNRTPADVGKGSNGYMLGVVLDNVSQIPSIGVSVHVNDVARAHIDALNPALTGNRDYLCSSGGVDGTTWDDAKEIVKRHFPEAVADGRLPLAGSLPTRPLHFDSSETENAFGWKFASFEEQVKSVVGHYLELLATK